MSSTIPHVAFESRYTEVNGVEILRLEELMSRIEDLDPHPGKAHQLEFYMLVFYTEGNTEHLADFVWEKVEKNTLIYLTKGQVNAFKLTPEAKGYVLLFTEDYFKKQLNNLSQDTVIRLFTSHLFPAKIQLPESSNLESYITLFFQEFYNIESGPNKNNIIDALYIVLFSKIEYLKQQQTVHIKESDKLTLFFNFQTILEKNFTVSRNADFYAEKLNITYKHLNVVCKEIVNSTAKQFIDEFIVLESKRRLINSSIKSTELAFMMGFEESTNFVKYFKKLTGSTPNEFKKSMI